MVGFLAASAALSLPLSDNFCFCFFGASRATVPSTTFVGGDAGLARGGGARSARGGGP